MIKKIILTVSILLIYSNLFAQQHADHGVEKEWNMGVRLNAAYSTHIGKISAGPSISLDITNTTAVVYGLTVGVGF